jgi:PST family polysaccharide transporter
VAAQFGTEVRAAFSNLLFKGLSLSLEKGCRVLVVIVCAPVLGQAAFGRFQFATAVTSMLALGTDLGLGIWTTRALARSQSRASTIVGTGLRVRALSALPYALLTALVAFFMGPGDARAAILLLGVSALASAFVDHFGAILRGYERFGDEARLNAARALLVGSSALVAIWLGRSLVTLAAGMMAGTLASAICGLWIIRQRGGQLTLLLGGAFDSRQARTAIREALPIWLAGLFSLLYFKGDAVLLRLLAGDAELGAYSAAYKIFEGSMLVPAVLMATAFPPLSRAHGDRERQRRWEMLMACVLLGLGLVVGLVFAVGRSGIINVLFGQAFARAVPSLRLLSYGVPLMYLNCGLTHFLIARDLGSKNLVFAVSMLVLNVGLNLVLIPRSGGPGAAWATILTEAALTACCLVTLSSRAAPQDASVPPAARTSHTEG